MEDREWTILYLLSSLKPGGDMMHFSLLPLVVPTLALLGFVYGMDWLYTRSYDRPFSWALVLISAGAVIVGNALHVWSVNDRIRILEENVDRLADVVYETRDRGLKRRLD